MPIHVFPRRGRLVSGHAAGHLLPLLAGKVTQRRGELYCRLTWIRQKSGVVLAAADGLAIMNSMARVASVITAVFLATTAPCARSAGPGGGGGHGGSGSHGGGHSSGGHGAGGHSGHFAGNSSVGNSSGHSAVHSMGHSFARIFGHHGKPSASAQPATTPVNSQNAGVIFLPKPRLPRPTPPARLASQARFGFFPRHRRFGFGGCPLFPDPGNSFLFGDPFLCFNDGFFLNPFLFGFYDQWFGAPLWYGDYTDSPAMTPPPEGPAPPDSSANAPTGYNLSNSEGTAAPPPNPPNDQRPVTLLQLRDGSMYGLTDYWVEGDKLHYLHYKTTYGGENSVSFEQIDFEKTLKLNADTGVPFVLRSVHD